MVFLRFIVLISIATSLIFTAAKYSMTLPEVFNDLLMDMI